MMSALSRNNYARTNCDEENSPDRWSVVLRPSIAVRPDVNLLPISPPTVLDLHLNTKRILSISKCQEQSKNDKNTWSIHDRSSSEPAVFVPDGSDDGRPIDRRPDEDDEPSDDGRGRRGRIGASDRRALRGPYDDGPGLSTAPTTDGVDGRNKTMMRGSGEGGRPWAKERRSRPRSWRRRKERGEIK